MTLTLVWLLSTMQVAIADASCGEHAVRWVEAGKTVQRKEKLCIDGTHASSTECSNPKDLKCYFSKFKPEHSLNSLAGQQGSPGFKLCRLLNGTPQSFEAEIKKVGWKGFERCFSPDQKQFLDIDELLTLLLKSRHTKVKPAG